MAKGTMFIVSAPSGTGKTTILKKVIAELENVAFSVSHTTRAPRSGETEGEDYFFIDRETFESMKRNGLFLEWAAVHGNYYGTSIKAVGDSLEQGRDIILDIDVQGARQVKEKTAVADSVCIFIAPPSLAELENRLRKRNTEAESVVEVRLQNARRELTDMDRYDYVIVNDVVEDAVQVLRSIIIAERSRKRRGVSGEALQFRTV